MSSEHSSPRSTPPTILNLSSAGYSELPVDDRRRAQVMSPESMRSPRRRESSHLDNRATATPGPTSIEMESESQVFDERAERADSAKPSPQSIRSGSDNYRALSPGVHGSASPSSDHSNGSSMRASQRSMGPLLPENWGEDYLRNCRIPDQVLKELRGTRCGPSRRLAAFYECQNATIDNLLDPIVPLDPADSHFMQRKVYFAVYGSLAANVVLFCLQLTAAITSQSLSLAAAVADSFMDLLSGIILSLATWSAGRENILLYPTGKKRFHTVGLMLFASMMSVLSVLLMVESVKQLITDLHKETKVDLLQIVLVCVGLLIKLILLMYCWACRHNPSARLLVQDHRNDIIVNSFGLVMAFLGSLLYKSGYAWIDPVGAIVIGIIILVSWTSTAWENVVLIVGRTAPPNFLNRLTYIAATHDDRIMQVDTCRAYSLGHSMFVEVDIVLPPDMSLKESHDIGESLQKKIELIEDVERAFVHCDYEFTHRPEH